MVRLSSMFYTTRFRLILSFLGMIVLVGGLSLIVGASLINGAVLSEASMRIRLDLNAAREIYLNREKLIDVGLRITRLDTDFLRAVEQLNLTVINKRLQAVSGQMNLDFAGVVIPGEPGGHARTISRLGAVTDNVDPTALNPLAALALERKEMVSGTVILEPQHLLAESPDLAERSRIEIMPTPKAAPRPDTEETSGMAIGSAIPLYQNNILVGILYGGTLLNRSSDIVDTVRQTVFQHETYRDQSIGTATIFFKDLRISTNVLTAEGKRAIGTRVSEEVNKMVLIKGERWTDRAFVVNDWYITAYEPIRDVLGEIVGILYVGVLEAKYNDLQRNALLIFVLITAAGAIVAIIMGNILGHLILKPVQQLIEMSKKVSMGDLSPKIARISKSEIGVLQNTFMDMLSSIRERDQRQKADSEYKILQSEKQATVGRLAAGVAHEINNPLTGVLTFTHMLLRRQDLDSEIRSDLDTIAQSTERVREIVKGLLNFARQTRLNPESTDINELIRKTISLLESQALVKKINVSFDSCDVLPRRTLDRNQFQSVLMNIIINAIDATDPGGQVSIATGISFSTSQVKGIEIIISDTGCGISPEHLDRLFDPFFTTKEVGQGTGLGLSVSMGIVERHGGSIRVRSKAGKGSTFIIWLPIEEQRNRV